MENVQNPPKKLKVSPAIEFETSASKQMLLPTTFWFCTEINSFNMNISTIFFWVKKVFLVVCFSETCSMADRKF